MLTFLLFSLPIILFFVGISWHMTFNESFSRTPLGVTEKFQPTVGGIDPGTFGTLNECATFTPTRQQ